ncbi:MAG: protein phosphatase 2C domain-containing protein [Armatimonadota bacterium]
MQVIESIRAGGACNPGMVRESNEDRCFYRTFIYTGELGQEYGLIAAVADGMGGHAAGEAASERAVQVLASRFAKVSTSDQSRQISPDWPSLLRDAFNHANTEVHDEAARWPGRAGMGTTLATVIIAGDVMYFAHVGDSRIYLVRNDRIIRLTEDHTWVAQCVREGRMSAREAETSDRRGQLTRVIGLNDTVQADIDAVGLRPGDRIVLCTDGITEMLSETDISVIAGSRTDMQKAAARLIYAANRAGGYDNSAAVIISCQGEPSKLPVKLPRFNRTPPQWAVLALALIIALLLANGAYLVGRVMSHEKVPSDREMTIPLPKHKTEQSAPLSEHHSDGSGMLDLSGKPVEADK